MTAQPLSDSSLALFKRAAQKWARSPDPAWVIASEGMMRLIEEIERVRDQPFPEPWAYAVVFPGGERIAYDTLEQAEKAMDAHGGSICEAVPLFPRKV